MKKALLAVAAAVAALLTAPHALAAPPVLDGKKSANLNVTQEAPTDAVGVTDPAIADVAKCDIPRCGRIDFVYKPVGAAKKAPLSIKHKQFYVGTTDTDLYLLQGSTVIASCTGFVSNARYLQVPASKLVAGKTYSAIMYFSHSTGETVRMDVDLPGKPGRAAQYVDQADVFQTSLTMCGT